MNAQMFYEINNLLCGFFAAFDKREWSLMSTCLAPQVFIVCAGAGSLEPSCKAAQGSPACAPACAAPLQKPARGNPGPRRRANGRAPHRLKRKQDPSKSNTYRRLSLPQRKSLDPTAISQSHPNSLR